ncbi:MAG: hypothetical protein J6K13_04860 [Clostridia bacterium]|nr:hypothetical protein [Clostridia bacterium]
MKRKSVENQGNLHSDFEKENLHPGKGRFSQKTWTRQKTWIRAFAGKDGVLRLCGAMRVKISRKKVEKVLENVLQF